MRLRGRLLALACAALAAIGAACAESAPPGAVHVLTADTALSHVLVRYIDRGIDRAEAEGAAAVVIRVNTPGGDIDSMRAVVGRIEQAGVPVLTFVTPPGARAASAGTFVVMAGHIAAMAPSTSIGAATPVTATGEDVEGALGRKVENDTVAFARAVAELRGRNADWAEAAVRDAASATPAEAAAENIVDLEATSLLELLAEAHGRSVRLLSGEERTLDVREAPLYVNDRNAYERALEILGDPIVLSILIAVGVSGLAVEILSPGLFLPAVVGITATIASLLGIGSLLPTEAAVALLVLGIALLTLEAFSGSGGILGSGGAVAIVLALSIFVGQGSTEIDLRRILAMGALALIATGTVAAVGAAWIGRHYLSATERSEPGRGARL